MGRYLCQNLTTFANERSQSRSPQYKCTYQIWWKSTEIYSSYCPESKIRMNYGQITLSKIYFWLKFHPNNDLLKDFKSRVENSITMSTQLGTLETTCAFTVRRMCTVNVLKFQTLYSKPVWPVLLFMQLLLKIHSWMANSVDLDLQEQSDMGLHCLHKSFCVRPLVYKILGHLLYHKINRRICDL